MTNQKSEFLTPINHIVFVIDESGSMRPHRRKVEQVFDEQVKLLAKNSVELKQETRVSLYTFNATEGIRCVAYDRDVLRLPSLAGLYRPTGGTPLVRATLQALADLERTPELYADHAFLVYVITDGEETEARGTSLPSHLSRSLERSASLGNWTVAALVPNQRGVELCSNLGFQRGNIQIWDTADVQTAGDAIRQSTAQYMTLRSQGVRSTENLFTAQVNAKRTEVCAKLRPVTNPYTVYSLPTTAARQAIKDFVEAKTGKEYLVGSAYYQLIKPETIQSNKRICLRTVPDGRLFSGSLDEVRAVLGLPTGGDIKVVPGEIKDFVVFVESTSVNRNVIPGQEILVLKL